MDKELARLIDADTPKLNPVLANGLAVRDMQRVEDYIDRVLRAAASDFPPGLEYVNCVRCTPQEEFEQLTKIKNNRRTFDTARSDLYMMKYYFRYKGEMIEPPRYLSLPFISDAGTITLGGSRFNISPLLSDPVISVGLNSIFVRLLKARLILERMDQHYQIDGVRETVKVAWSSIYNKNSKMLNMRDSGLDAKSIVRANCTLMHYLLCKYGFTDTFLKYAGARPVVGDSHSITRDMYPEEDWVICSSTRVRPKKGFARGAFWQPTDVHVAVRRSELTPMVKNMLGGFFYVAEHFPAQVLPEHVDSTRMWMILMGQIIFTGNYHAGKLYDDTEDHMKSLDEYIDKMTMTKLQDSGVEIANVYDLFALMIKNFNDMVLSSKDKIASMYDKELSILYFVLYEITSAIFKLSFKLKAAAKKQELSRNEIVNYMNMTLKPGLIYSITKNHGEVSTISVSGDNKAFKITSLLVPQSSSNRQTSRKDRAGLSDPSKRAHVSIAEIGGYLNLPKSQPDGRARLNPMTKIDEKNVIVRNPEFIPLTDEVQKLLGR